MLRTAGRFVVAALLVACGKGTGGPVASGPPGPGVLADGARPHPDGAVVAGGAPPAASAARWMDEFPAYPNARELCYQHISGDTMHIFVLQYATTDAPETVVAFYVRETGQAAGADARRFSFAGTGDRHLDVNPAHEAGVPSCGTKPAASDQTIVIVSRAMQ